MFTQKSLFRLANRELATTLKNARTQNATFATTKTFTTQPKNSVEILTKMYVESKVKTANLKAQYESSLKTTEAIKDSLKDLQAYDPKFLNQRYSAAAQKLTDSEDKGTYSASMRPSSGG